MNTSTPKFANPAVGVLWQFAGITPQRLFGLLVMVWATAAVFLLRDGSYRVVALAVVWAPYLIIRPKTGLWFGPALMMAASLLSPPEGFEAGVGYSPELIFWAVAMAIAAGATAVAAARQLRASETKGRATIRVPKAFYAFSAVSLAGAAIGVAHGYPLDNVAKQFFGCLLFLGYFWFAAKLGPKIEDLKETTKVITAWCGVFSLVYVIRYIYAGTFVHDTVLADYAGSVACLLLPQFITRKVSALVRTFGTTILVLAVPFIGQWKRAIAGFAICTLLLFGLRSSTMAKRRLWLLACFLVFTLLLATPILNYVGQAVSKDAALSWLIPEDVQTNDSVYLRLEQARQMLSSTAGQPLFGTGLGSTLSWFNPYVWAVWNQETVDMGWAYLLVKLGIVGLISFVWLVGDLLLRSMNKTPDETYLSLILLVVYFAIGMVAGVMFVYFMTAAWAGTACGFLHVLNHKSAEDGARMS